jgi:hypothetical protein
MDKVRELVSDKKVDVNTPDNGKEAERAKRDQGKKKKKEEKDEPADPRFRVAEKISGDYPLHIAAANGHVAIIEFLFYSGALTENKNK